MPPIPPRKSLPDLVRRILETRGVTLFQLSRESHERYRDPHEHIPHQFYSDLRSPGFSPHVQQIFTLSTLTGYRFADWLSVFGFCLEDIPRMQALLPAQRTLLLDTSLGDDQQWVPWFTDNPLPTLPRGILPLSQLLSAGISRRAASLLPRKPSPFLYAKVGWEDALAFPDLLPGSIVRVDTRRNNHSLSAGGDPTRAILLVEHAKGFCLCRVHATRPGYLTLRSNQLAFAQLELRTEREARILGTADVELRCLIDSAEPQIPAGSCSYAPPEALLPVRAKLPPGRLLGIARARAGLSFRAASALSRRVALELGDPRYFCSPGALSDYETRSGPPRRAHKLITLAILYSLGWETLLEAAGLATAAAGHEPLPESLLPRPRASTGVRSPVERPSETMGFLFDLIQQFEEIPLSLRNSLASIVGLPKLSLRDVYWMGEERVSLQAYLKGAVFAAVNRRSKNPVTLPGKALWAQPLYLLLTRSSGWLVTACHVEGDFLVAHPLAEGLDRPRRFRNGVDAEVVGRVAALLRRLRGHRLSLAGRYLASLTVLNDEVQGYEREQDDKQRDNRLSSPEVLAAGWDAVPQ